MPTPPTSDLPKPKSWDEFEDIVWEIYKRKWQDSGAQRYGRSGQAQNGIDIYGRKNGSGAYIGVQCKRYEDNKLSQKVIKNEVAKAESFTPPISEYIIATTVSRDKKVQDFVRLFNEGRNAGEQFLVHVVFWEDICSDLADPNNHDLLKKYYSKWAETFQNFEQKNNSISPLEAKENYLKQLRNNFGDVTFAGIDLEEHEGSQPRALTQIFVIPDIEAEPVPNVSNKLLNQQQQKTGRVTANKLFKNDNIKSILLLGAPGSGKTALVNYFVLMLCGQDLETQSKFLSVSRSKLQPSCIGLSNEIDWLPIVIRIRDLARHPEMSILEFARYFAENTLSCATLPQDFFENWLIDGRAVIFFDGLDEVAQAQQVEFIERIKAFLSQYDQNRSVITSRPVGNPGWYFQVEKFPRYRIQPFDNRQIHLFIHRWYDNYCLDKTEADRRKATLRRTLNANDRIKLLARNPLLLTIILLIHHDHVQLPKERCELYDCAIKTLLGSWDENKVLSNQTVLQYLEQDDLRWLMARLAYWIHTQGKTGEERTLIERDDLIEQLSTYIQDEKKVRPDQAEAEAKRFLDQIVRDRAGLLSNQGEGYAFVHKTFQEYLTAENLCNQAKNQHEFEQLLHEVQSQLNNPHWNEVILLLVAQLTGKKAAQMLQTILQRNSDYERWLHRDLLFAGRCLAENPRKLWQKDPQLITEILTQLIELEITNDVCVVWKIKQQIPSILLNLNGTCFSREALRISKSYSSKIPPKQILLYQLVLGEHQEAIDNLLLIFKDGEACASGLEILEKIVTYSNISDFLVQHLCSSFQGEIGIAKALRRLGYQGELRDHIDYILMNEDEKEMAYEEYMKQQAEEAERQQIEEAKTIYSEIEPLLNELRSGSILVIDSLMEWLDYDEYNVSEYIAKELGKVSHASQLIEQKLLEKLQDESSWGRSNTVQALGYLNHPSEDVISTLIPLLHHDTDEFVRANAAKTLSLLNVAHDVILSHLLNSFRDLNRPEDFCIDGLYLNTTVSEALVQLSKSFNPVVPTLAQWIEQNQHKEYVEHGINALLKILVGE
jgi:GTP cyclohydrolase II